MSLVTTIGKLMKRRFDQLFSDNDGTIEDIPGDKHLKNSTDPPTMQNM